MVNIAAGADVATLGFAGAAVGFSPTVIGGAGFGALAGGSRLVSMGANTLKAFSQGTRGDYVGAGATAASIAVGFSVPSGLIKGQAVVARYGGPAMTPARGIVGEGAGMVAGQIVENGICAASEAK